MRFFSGFIIGLVLGAVAVLLTTPQSGSDMQEGVRSRIEDIMNEGRQAAASRRAELESRLTDLRMG